MKNIFNKVLNISPYVILILLTAYISRGLFVERGIATFVDTAPFNLNMETLHNFATNLWVEKYTGGWIYSSLPAYIQNFFAMNIIYSIINFFTKNILINNVLWVYLPYPIFAISVFSFVKLFVKNKVIALLATLIYIFSYIYFMWFIASGSNILVWAVSGSIWFSYSFIRMLEAKTTQERIKYSLIGVLASLVAMSNIAYFLVFVIFCFLYFALGTLYNEKGQSSKEFINAIWWGAAVVISNLFWIVPTFVMKGGDVLKLGGNEDPALIYHSSCATPVRNIMYMFCGAEPSERKYYSILFVLIFSLIATYVFRKKEKTTSVLFISFIIFYILSLGINTPAGRIVSKLPGAFLLRTPQRVFEVMLLIFVTLLAITIHKYKSQLALLLALLLIIVVTRPNPFLFSTGYNLKGDVPSSYTETRDFLAKENQKYRVLIYPAMPNFMAKTWGRDKLISPPTIDYYINERSVIYWLKGETVPQVLVKLFSTEYMNKENINFEKILGHFNIKYILLQTDIRKQYLPEPIDSFTNITKKITNNKVFDTNELKIYQVDDKYVLPLFYAPAKTVQSETSDVFDTLSKSDFGTAIVDKNTPTGTYSTATISYEKISPSKYKVRVRGSGDKLLLVFQERFHPGWILKDAKTAGINGYGEHIKVNDFENGWLLDVGKLCRDNKCDKEADGTYSFDLTAEYFPQTVFFIFLIADALFVCTLLGSYTIIKMRKEKK